MNSIDVMKKELILIPLMGVLMACHNTISNECDDVTIINFKDEALTPDSVKLILTTSFLKLEETEGIVLGDIAGITSYQERLFVADGQAHSLFVFNHDGGYIGRVGSRGNGPGEYINVTSFYIDSIAGDVCVYDDQQKKQLRYRLDSFDFVGERTYKQVISNECMPVNGGLIWYNQAYEGEYADSYFITTDTTGTVTGEYVRKEFKTGYITGASIPLYGVDGVIHGYTPYDMTIYEYTGKDMKPVYSLKCGDFEVPDIDFLKKISKDGTSASLFSTLSESGYISYYDVMETSESLCLNIIVNGETYIGFYNKTNGRTIFMSQQELSESLQLGSISYFIPFTLDGCFLAVIEPDNVNEIIDKAGVVDARLAQLVRGETSDSNPVIVKIGFN